MKILHIFFGLVLLWTAATASAQQVTLFTPSVTVKPGSNVHFDIKVKNFQQITAVQFSLKWNKDVIQFIGVDNFNLPGLVTDLNFGLLKTDQGELRFSWVQNDLKGFTLKDSLQLFSIWFKAIGPEASNTKVSFSNDPIVIEIINTSGAQPFQIDNGTITVKMLTSTDEVITSDFVLHQNSPNPFRESTQVSFEMSRAVPGRITLHDTSGRLIYEEEKYFQSGKHFLTFKRSVFRKAGTYFFTLQTSAGSGSRRMVVQ
jgi:hypothetical protein